MSSLIECMKKGKTQFHSIFVIFSTLSSDDIVVLGAKVLEQQLPKFLFLHYASFEVSSICSPSVQLALKEENLRYVYFHTIETF